MTLRALLLPVLLVVIVEGRTAVRVGGGVVRRIIGRGGAERTSRDVTRLLLALGLGCLRLGGETALEQVLSGGGSGLLLPETIELLLRGEG